MEHEIVTSEPIDQSYSTRQVQPQRLITLGTLLGAVMIAVAIIWAGILRNQPLDMVWFSGRLLVDIPLGLLLGGLFSLILWVVGPHIEGFRVIRELLIKTIDFSALKFWHIIVISLIAAIPEELLFRGAVQPVTGLILASLIFGAMHAITPLYFFYATLAGLWLGLLAQWHDNLWLPIAAHFAVDAVALFLFARWVRTHDNNPSLEAAHLVSGEPSA